MLRFYAYLSPYILRRAARVFLAEDRSDEFNPLRPVYMCQAVAMAAWNDGRVCYQHSAREEFVLVLKSMGVRTDGAAFEDLPSLAAKQAARKKFLLDLADMIEAVN